jgi:hypothetical protein
MANEEGAVGKPKPSRYAEIIERIFLSRYEPGATEVPFARSDIVSAAEELEIDLPKNLGDVIYSFRYRTELPASVRECAPEGMEWQIQSAGRGNYRFKAVHRLNVVPNTSLAETKVPDATPGIISMYALSDEQALLAKLRYNRLIDIFTGVAAFSLQSHLRTTVPDIGQVETDEVYVGIDRRGAQYVIPVQAKGGSDRLSPVQIEQDIALCASKFPQLICRPIGAQFMAADLIALFEFEKQETGLAISSEKHYRLVPPEELSPEDLAAYRLRSD